VRLPAERAAEERGLAVADLGVLGRERRDGAVPLEERDALLIALHFRHEAVLRLVLGERVETRRGLPRELSLEVGMEPHLPGRQHLIERFGAELPYDRVEELGREGLVVLGEESVGRGRKPVAPHRPADRPGLELASHEARRLEPPEDRSRRNRADAELSGQVLRGQRPVEAEPLKNLRL
jgi:hypothetical protein